MKEKLLPFFVSLSLGEMVEWVDATDLKSVDLRS